MVNFNSICKVIEDELMAFLHEKELLHSEGVCATGHAVKLTTGRSGRSPTWRCQPNGCSQDISVRKGTWFDGQRRRTPLETAVLFIYDWCRQVNSIQNCERELGNVQKYCSDVE
uniref:SRCR domain-containing protein n=1 Tax=Trichuris muris TaxID=70415 RepID=A0A5S6QAT9_TRIMR